MEKIKNDAFKKFENNAIQLKDVYGGMANPTAVTTNVESSTWLLWTDNSTDTDYVTDNDASNLLPAMNNVSSR